MKKCALSPCIPFFNASILSTTWNKEQKSCSSPAYRRRTGKKELCAALFPCGKKKGTAPFLSEQVQILDCKQLAFCVKAVCVASKPSCAKYAVARNKHGNRVCPHRLSHCLRGLRHSYFSGNRPIGGRMSIGNFLKYFPNTHLERRALQMECRHGGKRLAGKIGLQPAQSLKQMARRSGKVSGRHFFSLNLYSER